MEHKPLFADLIAAHKGQAEELKTGDVAADSKLLLHEHGMSREDLASDGVRAKLDERQLMPADVAAAVEWARGECAQRVNP
jgi:hypothetical protein